MLGVMLRHQPADNQQSYMNRMNARELAIQERRRRIEEATKERDNSGILGKLLSITAIGVVVANVNKLFDTMQKNGVDNYEKATAFFSKLDPLATKDQIEDVLEIMQEHIKEFDKELFKNRVIAYELNELQKDRLEQENISEQIKEKALENQEEQLVEKNKEMELRSVDL